MHRAFVIALLFTAAGCSKHPAPPERVDPDQLESFIAAQQAALNRAEADEAAENAAEARSEMNQAAGNAGGARVE